MRHECEWEREGQDEGDVYFCKRQAVGKWHGLWYCQIHLDEVMGIEDAVLKYKRKQPSNPDTFLD